MQRRLCFLGLLAVLAPMLAAIPSSRAENDTQLVRDPLARGLTRQSQLSREQVWREQHWREPAGGEHGLREPGTRRAPPRTVMRYDEQRGWYPVILPPPQPRRPPPPENPAVAKTDAAHVIAVLGDSLADLLGHGLEDALADRPDAAVLRKVRSDSGLVRSDYHDWPKAARELLAANGRITLGVILLGMNDRQPIREGDSVHEPLSERWKDLYRQRIDDVVAAFAEKRVTLLWVGSPPMQSGRLSADLIVLNDLFRQRVERGGGLYIDLWGGFVDDDNRYATNGPDLSGQITRLRSGDGIHFTKAGARKAAHFADVAIRRLLDRDGSRNAVSLPIPDFDAPKAGRDARPGAIERLIDAMVSGIPDADRLIPIPVKPLAGPVMPLNIRPVARAGEGVLLERPAISPRNDAAIQLDAVFVEGAPPVPRPGRADDHRWPRTDR
jgi:hypothetical protein